MITIKQLLNPMDNDDMIVTVCYARNGHRLYRCSLGVLKNLDNHICDYYVGYVHINIAKNSIYLEATEDTTWWED